MRPSEQRNWLFAICILLALLAYLRVSWNTAGAQAPEPTPTVQPFEPTATPTATATATPQPTATPTEIPVEANAANTCEIVQRSNGQFVRQTAGTAGQISVYVDGEYATYIPRKNRLYYATDDKDAVVRGYDADGIVC